MIIILKKYAFLLFGLIPGILSGCSRRKRWPAAPFLSPEKWSKKRFYRIGLQFIVVGGVVWTGLVFCGLDQYKIPLGIKHGKHVEVEAGPFMLIFLVYGVGIIIGTAISDD